MNNSSVLPTRRALAWAALWYLLVIVALALPRVIGSSWRSIMSPRDMRNLEGYPVQWEAFLILRSLRTMSSNEVRDYPIEWYSTDEYRAILPTYLASVVSQLTKSYVLGITVSELIWWWIGAFAVFLLARSFLPTVTAFCSGILTCASPLGVGHIGSAHLHTASSLSLSVFLFFAWKILHSNRFRMFTKGLMYGICIYLSSITYTYQWFLAPFFIVLTAIPKFSYQRVSASIVGVGFFLVLRLASYGILALGDLEVHANINYPLRFLQDRLLSEVALTSGQWVAIRSFLAGRTVDVIHDTVSSYHVAIVCSAALGLLCVRDARFDVAAGAAVALGFVSQAIDGVAWVLVTGSPFIYMLGVHAIVVLAQMTVARLPRLRDDPRTPRALLGACTTVAVALTNLDLIGDESFAIGWWE